MKDVFSDFIRRLTAGGDQVGREGYDEAREYLRAVLVTELRKRSLWTSPPAYLGVIAHSWLDDDALDELVDEAYDYNFIDRLRSLASQLKVKKSVDGLVRRNVRHFLTDRQRQADPLGYRVFVRLRCAAESLLEKKRLFVRNAADLDDDAALERVAEESIRNMTVLQFARRPTADITEARTLEPLVSPWLDRLMPDLVIAEGRSVPKVIEGLAQDVAALPEAGVLAFRFGHLTKALKDGARRRWRAVWEDLRETALTDGAPDSPRVPVIRPNAEPDWPRFRDAVLRCVERQIAAIPQPKRERDLRKVWLFVRGSRLEDPDPRQLPSSSELGRQLKLPRERVTQILDQLKSLVCCCCHSNPSPMHEDHAAPRHPGRRSAWR